VTATDLVIRDLADGEAAALEANRQLIDLAADLTLEIVTWRTMYEREIVARVHGDRTIERLQRQLHQRAV
jgi:hypothetical protein